MKNKMILVFLTFSILSLTHHAYTQDTRLDAPADIRKTIELINVQTEELYRSQDVEGIVNQYAAEPAFLLDYKSAIFETEKLTMFFTDWFRVSNVQSFQKKIYSLEVVGEHVLELGTLDMSYTNTDEVQKSYSGNYLILWMEDQGEFKMLSHAMGSDKDIKLVDVPWAGVTVERNNIIAKHNVASRVLKMVEEADAKVIRAVKEGDGETRANGYTEDAILMPNFDKMYVGMSSIRPRMLNTYHPGVSYKVKHLFNRIYDLGAYVFVTGHYEGGWGDKKNGGWFSGNMTGLMKKTDDGRLKSHRQLTNRDRELLLFNN